jgi:saccharopine dehydrogenase-like NADP-dependent oxidoreductase
MTAAAKVLVIGGYGVFGGRLIQLLEDEPRLNLLVAGRSVDRASAFVRSRGNTAAELTPLSFDRNGDLAGYLAAIRPDIVVDANGPFKTHGADRYRVVQACVTQRVNYLDLADGSDFVAGIDAFVIH